VKPEEWATTTRFRSAVRALLDGRPGRRPSLLDRVRWWSRGAEPPPRPNPSDRQILLALAGLGRLYWSAGRPETGDGHREWVERCERFADDSPTPADRAAAPRESGEPFPPCPAEFVTYFVALMHSPRRVLVHLSMLGQGFPAIAALVDRFFPEDWAAGCDLLREVFGNPFRPVPFSPAWRTDTAVSLARQAYEGRDFALLPILADALQDAGCASPEVLDHCHGSGPHVRGCWVVDLVLGKG
jgi:hypothetical protein